VEEPTRGTNMLDLIIKLPRDLQENFVISLQISVVIHGHPVFFLAVLYGIFLLILSSNADVKWFQISFADASSSYSLLVVACVCWRFQLTSLGLESQST
jgi:hypothetical protein